MPVYRFLSKEPIKEQRELRICGQEFIHLKRVLRLRIGDLLSIIDGEGGLADASLKSIDKEHALVEINKIEQHPRAFNLSLVQGIVKPNKMDLIVEKATELGASKITFFSASKGDLKHLKEGRIQRLETISLAALKQSGGLYKPKIEVLSDLEAFEPHTKNCFYGDFTKNAISLNRLKKMDAMTWIVGPESGFSKDELSFLKNLGAHPVTLHPFTLRAETAAIAGLSLFAHHLAYD